MCLVFIKMTLSPTSCAGWYTRLCSPCVIAEVRAASFSGSWWKAFRRYVFRANVAERMAERDRSMLIVGARWRAGGFLKY